MKQDLTLLHSLIEGMDVPSLRKSDIGWLNRNLGVRNSNHPNFEKAKSIVEAEEKYDNFKNGF